MAWLSACLLSTTLGVLCVIIAPAGAQASDKGLLQRIWLDADGNPLPFRTDAELLSFMRDATVTSEKAIGIGINDSKKVLLEKDGILIHGIFREVDVRKRNQRVKDRMYLFFADSYLFEAAAFELAKMLGIDNVPLVVLRSVNGRRGTLQIWIEDVLDAKSEEFDPPEDVAWVSQLWDMYFFDNLIFNIDRNKGNLLVDSNYILWMIDHTRAFQAVSELLEPEKVLRVNREAWERLSTLTEDDLRGALSDYLTGPEIVSLMDRRRMLLDYVEKLVDERGEKLVFY